MTDNEIIKALKCCSSTSILDCADCPYWGTRRSCGVKQMKKDALNLINRQKAEIERLQKYNTDVTFKHYNDGIKEFAERLKANDFFANFTYKGEAGLIIDNLVKEMVGNQNA